MEAIGTSSAELAPDGLTADASAAVEPRHPQDLALARRAAQRDEAAWREIYHRTRQRLFALLAYHTGNREEALELLQETYLCAIRSLPRYDGRGSLDAWLAVIALRRACDWKRWLMRRRRRDRHLMQEHASDLDPATPTIVDERVRLQLHAALARLTVRQRSALLLHELAGLSFHAVGAALGCTEATARCHCFHARRMLLQILSSSPVCPPGCPATVSRPSGSVSTADDPGTTTEVKS